MATKTLTRTVTEDGFRVLQKCRKDIYYFANFINVVHPIRGKVPFNLYEYQKRVLYYFLTKRFNIILKFRQAGITELISMYCLWLAMFHPNKNIVIISIKDTVAKKVLRKIKYMYKNLPPYLQVQIVNGRSKDYGTSTEMEFSNGSMITSVPTTEEAGRSEAVSLLVIDEAAIVRWASTIWSAAFPTLSTGGASIVNSTPYGVGNWYHKQYTDAVAGGNDFFPIRLKWTMHPERDIEWYNSMRKSLGPRRTAQEIDGDFLTSGYSVFDLVAIREIEELLQDIDMWKTEYNGCLRLYNKPEKGVKYFIGVDISTGRSRDYSAFTIMTRDGEEVGCFKGKIPVLELIQLLIRIGKIYNRAVIAPEANDIGLAVVSGLQEKNYPNLYYSVKILRKKGQSKPEKETIPGWLTTKKNRPIIIDELVEDINEEVITIKDPFFVQEAYTFIYDERNKPIAMGKNSRTKDGDEGDQEYTDDSIMGKAICNFIRKAPMNSVVVAPK